MVDSLGVMGDEMGVTSGDGGGWVGCLQNLGDDKTLSSFSNLLSYTWMTSSI